MDHSSRASHLYPTILAISGFLVLTGTGLKAAELHIGGATTSITPDRPVPLSGQMHTRIAKQVESPVTATALALESRQGDKVLDQAILVSCDLVAIRDGIIEPVRRAAQGTDSRLRRAEAHPERHAHPHRTRDAGRVYDIPPEGVIRPAEYREFLIERVTGRGRGSLEGPEAGLVGWGLGHAVVAQNRRAVYADGHAEMYGKTDKRELPPDRGLRRPRRRGPLLLGPRPAAAWPRRSTSPARRRRWRDGSAVNADFWHEVREQLRARHGNDLLVLAWTGAGGRPVAPPDVPQGRRGADANAPRAHPAPGAGAAGRPGLGRSLRGGPQGDAPRRAPRPQGRADRSAGTAGDRDRGIHATAKNQAETLSKDPSKHARRGLAPGGRRPLERQQAGSVPPYDDGAARHPPGRRGDRDQRLRAVHRLRHRRSRPAAGPSRRFSSSSRGRDLRPHRAGRRGGGYSAIVQSSRVGPEGGQVLVERTLEAINALLAGSLSPEPRAGIQPLFGTVSRPARPGRPQVSAVRPGLRRTAVGTRRGVGTTPNERHQTYAMGYDHLFDVE